LNYMLYNYFMNKKNSFEEPQNLPLHPDYSENTLENEDEFFLNLIKNFGERFSVKKIKTLYKLLASFFKNPEWFKKKDEICRRLENKFGRKQCEQCFAYHLLVGSTPEPNLIQFFDFDGDDSIVKSIEEFVKPQKNNY